MKATTSSSVITTKLYYIIKVENVRWISTSTKYRLEKIHQEITFWCTKWRRILYLNVILQSWTTNCPADFDDQITFLLLQVIWVDKCMLLCYVGIGGIDRTKFLSIKNELWKTEHCFVFVDLASTPKSVVRKKIILPKVRPPSHTTYFYGTWHETKHKIINTVDCTVLIN